MKKKVLEFQIQAGEILEPTQKVIELKSRLLREEYEELKEALEEKDEVGILDALTDFMYVLLGFENILEGNKPKVDVLNIVTMTEQDELLKVVDELLKSLIYSYHLLDFLKQVWGSVVEALGYLDVFEEAFDRVHKSNMTKFAPTEEGAITTVMEYLGEGVVADYSEVGGLYTIYRKSDGKVLKYIDYEPVNLEDLC